MEPKKLAFLTTNRNQETKISISEVIRKHIATAKLQLSINSYFVNMVNTKNSI